MIDYVPKSELPIILEVVRKFIPLDTDDIATAEDIKAHEVAMEEYKRGKLIPHEEIKWE